MRVRKVSSNDVKLYDLTQVSAVGVKLYDMTKVKMKTAGNTSVVQFTAGNNKSCQM